MDNFETLKRSAKKLLRADYKKQAEVLLERALSVAQQRRDQLQIEILKGNLSFVREDDRLAIECYDRALKLNPSCTEARNWKGVALRRLCGGRNDAEPPEIYLIASVKTYRRFARELPTKSDIVVELGASTGATTRILAQRAGKVIAVEKTDEMFEMVEGQVKDYENVLLLKTDAQDLGEVLGQTGWADIVFVDIGGSAAPWQTMELAKKYSRLLHPKILVLRNTELNSLVASLKFHEKEQKGRPWGR